MEDDTVEETTLPTLPCDNLTCNTVHNFDNQESAPRAQLRRRGRNRLLRPAVRIAISPHQNYYYWGPRQYTGESLILLWISKMPVLVRQVDQGPTVAPYYGIEWEHYAILICHSCKPRLAEAWPQLKHWD
jgi:hypothetical protein